MKKPLIVALDAEDYGAAERLVMELAETVKFFKVGSELYTACGPRVIEMIHKNDGEVFLDLKFHDIPNTVAGAVQAAASLGVFMCNVHAHGGRRMMEAAAKARDSAKSRLKVIGVTVLTSMRDDDLREVGVAEKLSDQVLHLASLAREAGLDGVVCSGEESAVVRKLAPKPFLLVVPGVRPKWAGSDDQKRVTTPKEAFENGADFIVVGRPITAADEPAAAAEKILNEIQKGGAP